MLSNLVKQLSDAGAGDKLDKVLVEVAAVRKDFGEPPLVTPSSQIVGTQATMNVLTGERYKVVPKESFKLVKGEFGQSVKPVDPEISKKILKGETPITHRPADDLKPRLKEAESEMAVYKKQEEDVLSYVLFPEVAMEYFKFRKALDTGVDERLYDKTNKAYPV